MLSGEKSELLPPSTSGHCPGSESLTHVKILKCLLCAMDGVGGCRTGLLSVLSLGAGLQGTFRNGSTRPCFSFAAPLFIYFSPRINGKSTGRK